MMVTNQHLRHNLEGISPTDYPLLTAYADIKINKSGNANDIFITVLLMHATI